MVEKLMTNTVKVEDESLLPHIYPPELEYHLSSIFVEKAPQLVNPFIYLPMQLLSVFQQNLSNALFCIYRDTMALEAPRHCL